MEDNVKNEVILVNGTWDKIIKISWSFCWRYLLCYLLGHSIGAFVLWATNPSNRIISGISFAISLILTFFLSMIMTKIVLNKKFSDFKIILVEK